MSYPKSKEELIDILKILGFTAKEKTSLLTFKDIINIQVNENDFKKSSISYGAIAIKNKTICNFTKDEFFVQLECVVRLLNKGYSQESIVLERQFPVGRGLNKSGGRLDVCIYDKKNCWAMIECKTDGKEYKNEITNTLHDGGQIFSYLTQDRKAKTILVYASAPDTTQTKILSRYSQINTDSLSLNGDTEDIFSSWDQKFYSNGLFDSKVGLYETTKVNVRKEDLIDLTRDSGNKLFNNFDEILRKHVISDKSNAFNVIFNLFVCKIYDEDTKADNEELDFQTKVGDSNGMVLERLSLLYIESIEKYLSMQPNKKYLTNNMAIKEFSFIDVFNDETFYKNGFIR